MRMYYIIKLISLIHFQKMEIPVSSGKPEHQDIGTTTFWNENHYCAQISQTGHGRSYYFK